MVVCFHAQRAAEKYLKAFLVSRGQRIEHTHDLEYMLEQCLKHDPSLQVLSDDCVSLSSYAVDSRYPDVLSDDVAKLARAAITMSDRVCAAIGSRLI